MSFLGLEALENSRCEHLRQRIPMTWSSNYWASKNQTQSAFFFTKKRGVVVGKTKQNKNSQHFKELSTFHGPPDSKTILTSPISHQGVIIVPTQTMHLYKGNPSKWFICCIVSCPPQKNGLPFNDPLVIPHLPPLHFQEVGSCAPPRKCPLLMRSPVAASRKCPSHRHHLWRGT